MLLISAPWLFSFSALTFGIGYTLFMYSRDGDMDLRIKQKEKLKQRNLKTDDESWDALSALIQADSTEVTWNTSFFVSIVSSLVFLGLVDYSKKHELTPSTVGLVWLVSLVSVFFLQDLVIRWKAAHRKSAAIFEKISIVEQLRWTRALATLPINKNT